ncbi:MAG: MBL fold metallo-hydrolase [Dehalococcoidia bacterium]|jgi:7,8-dihydropterin-6-yl-methyl-4-(beta-D-ribofuranosyl)aminobenzene 5'-phosphate synthase|nr:MBL fold metallo-hydrolase [Dehalococcoidia bacterium]
MTITITVLYDNEVLSSPLRADWGFAVLIDDAGKRVLFDAGASGDILLHNARVLGEDLSTISACVLSHWHWDHAGGLNEVARLAPRARYFLPPGEATAWPQVRATVVAGEPVQVSAHVSSTGLVDGVEQALVVMSGVSALLITGCAHPGVPALLAAATRIARPSGLLGGLHGFAEYECLQDLAHVYACHCTQHKREIAAAFPEAVRTCGVGLRLTLE